MDRLRLLTLGSLTLLVGAAASASSAASQTAPAGASAVTVTSADLAAPVTISKINLRQYTGTTTERGRGVFITCDSGEIATGGFCEEVLNKDKDAQGHLVHNALLSSGVVSLRSVVCKWTNPGIYRVSATCLAIKPAAGDSTQGEYNSAQPGNVK